MTRILGIAVALTVLAGLAPAQIVFQDDFEAGLGAWTTSAGVWEVGVPTSGPTTVPSGTQLAATVLTGGYPAAPSSRLNSPPIALPTLFAGEELELRFAEWFSYGTCDGGYVDLRVQDPVTGAWSAWASVAQLIARGSDWSVRSVDLTSWAGEIVQFGFRHVVAEWSGCYGLGPGWYLDDVVVRRFTPFFGGDFEDGWGDWSADAGVWQVGVPSAGPAAAPQGVALAGTDLDANYDAYEDSRLVSPTVHLPAVVGAEEVHLRFQQWFSWAACDSGRVQVCWQDPSTGAWSAWTNLGVVLSQNSGWSTCDLDLTHLAGLAARIGFRHAAESYSGCYGEGAGWFVDDVSVQVVTPILDGDFEDGWGGWGADRGVWQVGLPGAGPSGASSGVMLAATYLGGTYPVETDSRLISPTIGLPAVSGLDEVHLRFDQWFDYSHCDSGSVQVAVRDATTGTWSPWEHVENRAAQDSPWSKGDVDLTPWAGQDVRVAFLHSSRNDSGCWGEGQGWFIDDVEVVVVEPGLHGSFEGGWQGWSATNGSWQVGDPIGGPGAPWSGHAAAGTVLGAPYSVETDSRLVSSTVQLPVPSAGRSLVLLFRDWNSYSNCDKGWVQVQTLDVTTGAWSAWSSVFGPVVGYEPWSKHEVDLSAYAGSIARIAFYHTSSEIMGCWGTSDGWFIDDVYIGQRTGGHWAAGGTRPAGAPSGFQLPSQARLGRTESTKLP